MKSAKLLRMKLCSVVGLLGALLFCLPCHAWWPDGHGVLSEAAALSLPEEMPKFFRESGKAIAHHSFDPDVLKSRATPISASVEHAEHYMDWELLSLARAERKLPETRYAFLKFCFEKQLDPAKVGLLPYAVAEWTERLTVAFAEYRRWPNNKRIQEKCLVYSGFVAHYAQDLCQPLHVTVHHDGRAASDGTSPHSGIHAKVDSLIEVLQLSPGELARQQDVKPLGRLLLSEIITELHRSRSYVDRVYELEAILPSEQQQAAAIHPQVRAFATQRARQSTRFTASLFLTAWRNSAQVELPVWLQRKP